MNIDFPMFSPKRQKLTLNPLSQNSKFEPKPDHPFTHELKYAIGFEIRPQIEVQIPKIWKS